MNWDEEFQKEYIIMDKTLPLITAINSIQVDLKDFIRWNSISDPQYILEANAWYRKSTPELADIHIVKAGENWNRISDLYQISIRDVLKLNREKPKSKLIPGRKIYLSRKRKKTENPIILTPVLQAIPSAKVSTITWKSPIELTPEERKVPVLCRPVSGQLKCKVEIAEEKPKFPELKSHWITHEVKKGEELWMLAKKYDTRGDLIQKINQLSTSRIKSGMKLKIFQVIAGRN
jgi:LysM repeat protein